MKNTLIKCKETLKIDNDKTFTIVYGLTHHVFFRTHNRTYTIFFKMTNPKIEQKNTIYIGSFDNIFLKRVKSTTNNEILKMLLTNKEKIYIRNLLL